jgi:hypothetical protein
MSSGVQFDTPVLIESTYLAVSAFPSVDAGIGYAVKSCLEGTVKSYFVSLLTNNLCVYLDFCSS